MNVVYFDTSALLKQYVTEIGMRTDNPNHHPWPSSQG